MPRLTTTATTATTDAAVAARSVREEVADLDTADRVRPTGVRGAMHMTREAEPDARNTPRMSIAGDVYRSPQHLDAPEPRPGYAQRWVRGEFRTESDNNNWQLRMREGWRPRDPKTVPEAEAFYGASSRSGQEVIRVGGLVLMEIQIERLEAKRQTVREATRRQELSVAMETDRVSREGMASGHAPIVREERTRVSTGRRPSTLAD